LPRLGVGEEREDLGQARLNRQRVLDPAVGLAELRQTIAGGSARDDEEDGRQCEADEAQSTCDSLSQ